MTTEVRVKTAEEVEEFIRDWKNGGVHTDFDLTSLVDEPEFAGHQARLEEAEREHYEERHKELQESIAKWNANLRLARGLKASDVDVVQELAMRVFVQLRATDTESGDEVLVRLAWAASKRFWKEHARE
jgi:hypothetical protein